MAAPKRKEVASPAREGGSHLLTPSFPSAFLADVPTANLISFEDDDVMSSRHGTHEIVTGVGRLSMETDPFLVGEKKVASHTGLLSASEPAFPGAQSRERSVAISRTLSPERQQQQQPTLDSGGLDGFEEFMAGRLSSAESSSGDQEKGTVEQTTAAGKERNTNMCRSDPPSPTSDDFQSKSVKLCGYLDKQGEKGILKSFKTRWFVFDDIRCRLYYYRNAQDTAALGSIDIANSSLTFDVTNPGSQRQFQIHCVAYQFTRSVETFSSPYAGYILRTDGRTYVLQAKDQHTMIFWLQELQERRRAFSSLKTSLSKERSLTRISVLSVQPCSGLVSTQKMKEKMKNPIPDSDIPPVMDYVEPPMHSVGEATATTTPRSGMFNLSLTSIKTDLRNQMSNLGLWKSPSTETPPESFGGNLQTDAAKQAEQGKQKSSNLKEIASHSGGVARAVFRWKHNNTSSGSPATMPAKTTAPNTTWFENVPDYDCKNCQQLSNEVSRLSEDLSQVKRELEESKEFIDLLHRQLTASQMQTSSNREFSLCQTDQEKLQVLQRKDKQLVQLEQLLQEMRNDRDSFKSQLGSCEKEVQELKEQINMFQDLIQAKDEIVVSLTMRVNELEKAEPLVIKTATDSAPTTQTPEVEGNTNLAGNTPADVMEPALPNSPTYVDPMEYELLKDSARAFEMQNKFLNKEILELNQLRNDAVVREKFLSEKYIDLEAEYCRTESKYLLLLNEVRGPQRGDRSDRGATDSDDIVSKLLAEAMDSEVKADKIKSYSQSSREQLYDKYGFISDEKSGQEDDNSLVTQATKLQKRSEEIKSKRSTAEVSRGVKWENYLVAHPEKDLSMTPELKTLIRGGIPHEYRARIWKWCVDMRVRKDKETTGTGYYQKLLDSKSFRSSPATKQIELDLLRTLPTNRHYDNLESQGIPKLRRVLLAYSVHNPAIGYCQGLNRVAAIALLYLEEEDAFWCLIAIVEYIMPVDYYSKTLIGSQTDQRVFRELLAEKIPRLNTHFEEYSIDLSLVTFNWFVTCFCDNIPAETMLRIWDTVLSEGNKVLFRYSLAAFKLFEDEILKLNDYLKIFAFLRRLPEMLTDIQRLSQIAFDELNPFPKRHINNKRAIHKAHVKQQLDELEAIRAEFVPRHSHNGDQMASDGEEEYDTIEALGTTS
ncbi:TBC1 domain family member 2B-like [Diadema setosum]|uniref:TBC1 domain family member 2B-like n=1 Tax=Diadema setosum TaxID=31175 RepID=UPI003B3B0AD1